MADGLVLPPGAGHRIGGASMTLKVGAGQSAIAALRARYDIEQLTPVIPDRR